ncbi:hypothetical protein EJ08DRAFT_636153 [Tothia fuscella]|uniref:BHLH domain-containing protein n=1 Tax=Tothia fuscella TaxID=1048955 RepID=A0A9P4NNM0_9PEZI|nr:hypothetical protein EJ08DRAFT_636153 [Tothia fuscella]
MTGSPSTFIKDEPDDNYSYNPNRIMTANGYNMHAQQYGHFATNNGDMSGINPSELTMMGNQYGPGMGSNSFHGGTNAGLGDDELLESLSGLEDQPQQYSNFNGGYAPQTSQGFFPDGAIAMSHGNSHAQMFSNTPDQGPISSPFQNNGFDYAQYRPGTGQQHSYSNSIPTSMGMPNGSFAARRMHPMERHPSDSRSPMTPTTPGIKNLNLGTPDSGHQTMLNQQLHQHAKMQSDQWAGNSGSQGSYLDSPLPSPQHGNFHHPQISEIIASGKHSKGQNGTHSASLPTAFQSQEAKKKRRRESHNAVERRRRDNINERIHDLSRLVPQHRLEDEKVRKHISNNGTMSPTLTASGISPPHATSLLAGGSGRRAAGNITQGLPIEEKDKGPNKGDILNGAVSWTRDLMWMLYNKLEEEEKLQQLLASLGREWPCEILEDEKRMRTELKAAVEKNGVQNFCYSRAHGSGLRVPNHTNYAGEPVSPTQGMSPAVHGSNHGSNSGAHTNMWVNQHSDSSGRGSLSLQELKEEGPDDFDLVMDS